MSREEIVKATKEATKGLSLGAAMRFRQCVAWTLSHLWKDAQGDDLPEIDREVIVIDIRGKVSYGHRPDPKGFNCKNIDTGKIERLVPMTYDKGGWNFPDIVWWLDAELPNLE